jgi:polar amino acid transport system substrate-binding protein
MRKLLAVFFSLSFCTAAHGEAITFTTEEYPPFNYRDGKTPVGATVEQVQEIMTGIGVDYTIEVMPWARAYLQAQTTPMTCVFATAHDGTRDKSFKWVEPLLVDHNILIKHAGSAVTAATLADASKYIVGTWRNDYTEATLRQANFTRIDIANDFRATLKKLMSDRIDLMPISELYFDKLKQDGNAVEKVATLSEQPMGIACQKDFPDELRQKMQAALDRLIADGTQKRIFLKYGLHLAN